MKINKESVVYSLIIVILSFLIFSQGKKNTILLAQLPLPAQDLFKLLGRSQIKMQIIDVREKLIDYDDTHIPGSIPLPQCEWKDLPKGVAENIYSYMPSIIVSQNGDEAIFKKCAPFFKNVRNLKGGIAAWLEVNLPEDSGEYFPPQLKAGGGCL
jgi:rhodanese-related sulfurtransferase